MFRYRKDTYGDFDCLRTTTQVCPGCFHDFKERSFSLCEACDVWFCSACTDYAAVGQDSLGRCDGCARFD